ncbi:MAG: RNA pseudouridine synthase [Alphaproteobacteria bacterium]|nr:RNA pseudouridine synthase [Alphaproteobacteria bacterium]
MTQKDNDTLKPLRIGAEQAGQRLDRALADAHGDFSRSRLKALIEDGHVRRAGTPVRQPSMKVSSGDVFEVEVPAPVDAIPIGQDIPLEILHEDDALIVIDKPAGLVVHPAPGNPDRTLVNALIAHCGDSLAGIGGVRRPGIVHRLDKNTSGVMVAAKTAAAHESLVSQFSARSVDRAYHAIVWGRPVPAQSEIEGAIGRHPKNRKKMAVVTRGGKRALTRFRTVDVYGGGLATLIECRLATGRTHQIRVHLGHQGHPIIGDPVYGRTTTRRAALKSLDSAAKAAISGFSRQALHAHRLGFSHPATGETIDFETKLPPDMASLTNILEML